MKDGVLHQFSCHTHSKKDALDFASKMKIVRKASGRRDALKLVDIFFPPDAGTAGRIPIADAWTRYLDVQKSTGMDNVAPRTMLHRGQVFRRFEKWLKLHPAVVDVEDVDGPVAAMFAAWLAKQKNRKGEPLTAKTRANVIAELSTIFTLLGKVSPSIGDPWNGLMPRATDGKRTNAFTREQEAAVMEAAKKIGKGWHLACLIARHTGLRYGDVANLRWDSIDLEKRIIDTKPIKTMRHGVVVVLPIQQALFDALSAIPEQERAGFVLPNHAELYGDPSEKAYKLLNFREVLDAAGIGEGWTFHSWRHTFRSRLADAGVDMETAKRLCGHTQDETSRHYDHAAHLDEYKKAIDAAATC